MKYTFSLFIITLLTLSVSAQIPVWKINTIAGNGVQGFNGDGFYARGEELSGPLAVNLDSAGNYYILDYYNNRIRKVNTAGIMTTVAGNGLPGNTGDNSLASTATMSPRGMAVDIAGNIFIADEAYSVIRRVDYATGIITRYAGNATFGYSGDGGSALNAQFRTPHGMTLDAAGNLFVADAGNHAIRKITPAGIISTVAGKDTAGYSGDFGLAIKAKLDSPYAVAVDRIGNIYISDHHNDVIRKVDTSGIITTYAGIYNTYSHTGDGGPATAATLNAPKGLTVDSIGNLYICDADNEVIRKVDLSGKITTIVGIGNQGFDGDLGTPLSAMLDNPYGIAIDKNGSIFIADANNQRVRKVYNATLLDVNTVARSCIEVYPNPVSGSIMVSGLVKSDKIVIYDMTGRQVTDTREVANDGTQIFKLNGLAPGTYLLQVLDKAGNRKTTAQLIKE